jgi:LacI family xylobiose transport system transcriptional regulator
MAEAAARLVLDLSKGRQPSMRRVDLATHLIVRSSTAAPSATA